MYEDPVRGCTAHPKPWTARIPGACSLWEKANWMRTGSPTASKGCAVQVHHSHTGHLMWAQTLYRSMRGVVIHSNLCAALHHGFGKVLLQSWGGFPSKGIQGLKLIPMQSLSALPSSPASILSQACATECGQGTLRIVINHAPSALIHVFSHGCMGCAQKLDITCARLERQKRNGSLVMRDKAVRVHGFLCFFCNSLAGSTLANLPYQGCNQDGLEPPRIAFKSTCESTPWGPVLIWEAARSHNHIELQCLSRDRSH